MRITVTDAPERHRYEARHDGELAGFVAYRLADPASEGAGTRTITLTHTEVQPAYEGKGVGSVLAREALEDARARGLDVIPACPFVRRWLTRHPEYADLVRPVAEP